MHDKESGGLELLQFAAGSVAGFDRSHELFGQRLIFVFLEARDHGIDDAGVSQDIAGGRAIGADLGLQDRRDLGAVEDGAFSVGADNGELSPAQVRLVALEVLDHGLGR